MPKETKTDTDKKTEAENVGLSAGLCRVCWQEGETRHINLFIYGSEGIYLCHECEMILVEHIRGLVTAAQRAHRNGYRACKKVHAA
jgi:hypothetical protein